MKFKTAITTIFLFFLFFFSLNQANAQHMHAPSFSGEVIINATINVDLYTQVSLQPSTVEVRQPSTVKIVTLLANGSPKVGRRIVIYIDGDSQGVTIKQPGLTDSFGQTTGSVSSTKPGVYTVCTKDITEGFDISITDCETLYVIPVPPPQMLPEPEYSKGTSNIVMWNMEGTGTYQYYAEVSTSSDFSKVLSNSGWVKNSAYEFTGLENGQIYFYRVKAKNSYGAESAWSNVVFSVQDALGPEIEFMAISEMGENTNVSWDRDYTITIRYRITDNVQVARKVFWCIAQNGSRYDCPHTAKENGDFWDIKVQLRHLEKTGSGNLFKQYKFCVEASDIVSNVSRNCDALLEVTIELLEEEIPPPKVPPIITETVDRLEEVFDDVLLKLEKKPLDNITTVVTAINLTVGLGFLIATLGSFPYLLLQFFFSILSLFGFRKKENVSGYVYDSITKEPIKQAVVRIYNEVHELIWTSVTDSHGYFKTPKVDDGEYYIKVAARNYVFPSKIIYGKKDFPLENVYHGDSFLTKEEEIPDFSIPMDEVDVRPLRKRFAWVVSRTKVVWNVLLVLFFLFGLLLSIYALIVTRIWWNYVMVSLYIPALVSLFYTTFFRKKQYGVVKDTEKNPVQGAIVGLNEKDFGKLVSKRITDELGRYKFLVDRGVYELSILNSDLKLLGEEKVDSIEIEKSGGHILAPDITVKRLEDEVEDDELLEPLEEL